MNQGYEMISMISEILRASSSITEKQEVYNWKNKLLFVCSMNGFCNATNFEW